MTEQEERKLVGIVKTYDFIFDAINGKLTILTNDATENAILSSVAEPSKKILKCDENFYFRKLTEKVTHHFSFGIQLNMDTNMINTKNLENLSPCVIFCF